MGHSHTYTSNPPLGAHIVTPRRGYTHHGVYAGAGRVVQYGPVSRGFWRGTVEEVTLEQFACGRPVWLRNPSFQWIDRPEVVSRARSRLGETRYHVLRNNCEHFCEWCTGGHPRSYQVETLVSCAHRLWRQLLTPIAGLRRPTPRPRQNLDLGAME